MELQTDKMIAEVDGAIGWMTFNQPEKRNAISLEMWGAVAEILAAFTADERVRVVVMKGAGEKAFVSGADISQFERQRGDAEAAREYGARSGDGARALARFEKPLIAMIQGYCMGGGLAISLNADVRVASDDARFGIPAARLGLGYGFDALRSLANVVGPAYAREIVMTARRYDAGEALRMGLVTRVVPREKLEAAVREYADAIAENAPLTVRAAKLIMREVVKDPDKRNVEAAERWVRECFDSDDYAEGRRAFMEKRKPVFRGR